MKYMQRLSDRPEPILQVRGTFMSNASQVFDVASKGKKKPRLEGENLKFKQTIGELALELK